MAAGPWVIYNDFIANVFKKVYNLNATDTIKVALVASTSNAIDKALVGANYGSITDEVANGDGYTTGGATAASPTITGGGATATTDFDTAAVAWTGSGSGFSARAAVMYDDTAASKQMIAYCLLDSAPADVTVGAGITLTLSIADVFSAA